MSEIRASRKPSRSKTSFAAPRSRARVSTPLRDRGPLGFSLVRGGGVVDTPVSFRDGSRGGGINVPSPPGAMGGHEGRSLASGVLPLQQEDAGGGPASGGHDRGVRVGDLRLAGVVPQLLHGFVNDPEAVRATLGQLTTVRVDGEFAVQGDPA